MRKQNWPKRDPIKNYFPLPNEIFSLGLSSTAIVIYGYLLYREDRKTYECLASYRMIGEAIGKSVTTVRKYVAELEERGLIATERTSIMTKDGRKWNGCLRYHILPIQMSIDQFNEQQLLRLEASADQQKAQARLSRLCAAQEPSVSAGQPTTPQRHEEACRGRAAPCRDVYEGAERSRIKVCRLDGATLTNSARSAGSLRGYEMTSFQREKRAFDLISALALRAVGPSPAPNTEFGGYYEQIRKHTQNDHSAVPVDGVPIRTGLPSGWQSEQKRIYRESHHPLPRFS